jgi:hypothetical protein
MNTPIVASPKPGPRLATVIPLRPPKAEPQVPPLGEKADQLLELRSLIHQAQDAERRLTGEIVNGLQAAGIPTVHGNPPGPPPCSLLEAENDGDDPPVGVADLCRSLRRSQ